MTARQRKPQVAGRGRRRNAHFMDVALDGYVRHTSLQLWRHVEALCEMGQHTTEQALRTAGRFDDMAEPYGAAWRRHWAEHVLAPLEVATDTPWEGLFARVEQAVAAAVAEERQLRQQRDDRSLEDTHDYRHFIDRALGRLLEEASGEIEEM